MPIERVPAVLIGSEGNGSHDRLRRPRSIELSAHHQHSNRVIQRQPALHDKRQGDQLGL
jgi:hypothetical protein